VVQVFTKRGDRIPDGKLVVTVRNEYGQSFRPKSIPVRSRTRTWLTRAEIMFDASGALRSPNQKPVPKPDRIADVPYKTVYDQQARF